MARHHTSFLSQAGSFLQHEVLKRPKRVDFCGHHILFVFTLKGNEKERRLLKKIIRE